MPHRLFLALCTALALSACGPNNSGKPTEPPKLFEEQRDALDKAKAVPGVEQKQDEEQRKAIEKQTQ